MSLLAELKRRRVFRVAGAYLVGAWIVLQVGDVVFPALRLPPWTLTLLVVLVVLGFPVALLLGWAFDITPGGIERTPGAPLKLNFPIRAAVLAKHAAAPHTTRSRSHPPRPAAAASFSTRTESSPLAASAACSHDHARSRLA